MKELTFFSSPIGLGHVTRDIAIVKKFENISTQFVTGSGAVKLLREYQLSVLDAYDPPQFVVNQGLLQNKLKWLWMYYQYYNKCKKISSKIIEQENSKIIVSDEDFASLTIAQSKKIPTILITDILETKFLRGFGSFIEKKMNKSMREIINKCNLVILPENGPDEGNIKRVGPIVREINANRDELRKKFGFDKKTVVVSVGGTSAGKFLIEKTIQAVEDLHDVDMVLVSGPSLPKTEENPVRSFGFVNNLHEIIFASDLVVSLAGKSTIDESHAYGTPGIFIPIKGHFEQEDNAAEEGYNFEDIQRLESLVQEKLAQKRITTSYDGAKKTAKLIQNLIEGI